MEPTTVAIACIAIVSLMAIGRFAVRRAVSYWRPKPVIVTPELLNHLRNDVHVRPDDVFVASFPKSGTTWMQKIVRLVMTAHGSLRADEKGKLSDVAPWLEGLNGYPIAGTDMSFSDVDALPSPRTLKTHMPYDKVPGGPPHTRAAKYIYVARNPKDTSVSMYHFMRHISLKGGHRTHSWRMSFRMFVNGVGDFGSWYDHVLGWWKQRNQPNILFMKYEDMSKNLPAAVKKVADFLDCHLEPEVIDNIADQCTFRNMKQDPKSNFNWISKNNMQGFNELVDCRAGAVFNIVRWVALHILPRDALAADQELMMRKGIVGDWKEHLTSEQSDEIDRLWVGKLRNQGLQFDFEL